MTIQPTPETDACFVPPAARNLPLAALDSATRGADMLDARATTPTGRNFLAHALVQLARDGWLRTEPGAAFEPCDDEPAAPAPPQDGPHAPQDDPKAPDAGAETPDGAGGRQTGADGRELLREQYAAAIEADAERPRDERVGIINAVLAVRDAELEQLRDQVKRLGMMVDEYGAGAGALTDKITRVRMVINTHRAHLQLTDPILLAKLDKALQSTTPALDAEEQS